MYTIPFFTLKVKVNSCKKHEIRMVLSQYEDVYFSAKHFYLNSNLRRITQKIQNKSPKRTACGFKMVYLRRVPRAMSGYMLLTGKKNKRINVLQVSNSCSFCLFFSH